MSKEFFLQLEHRAKRCCEASLRLSGLRALQCRKLLPVNSRGQIGKKGSKLAHQFVSILLLTALYHGHHNPIFTFLENSIDVRTGLILPLGQIGPYRPSLWQSVSSIKTSCPQWPEGLCGNPETGKLSI